MKQYVSRHLKVVLHVAGIIRSVYLINFKEIILGVSLNKRDSTVVYEFNDVNVCVLQ